MPQAYQLFAHFLARRTWSLVILTGVGLPTWAIFEAELGRPGKGVILLVWWLVLTTIWFGPKGNLRGVTAWGTAAISNVFAFFSLWLLAS